MALYLVIDSVLFFQPCMSDFHNHTHVCCKTNKYKKNIFVSLHLIYHPKKHYFTEIDSRVVEFENVDLSLCCGRAFLRQWYCMHRLGMWFCTMQPIFCPIQLFLWSFISAFFFLLGWFLFLTFGCLYWIVGERDGYDIQTKVPIALCSNQLTIWALCLKDFLASVALWSSVLWVFRGGIFLFCVFVYAVKWLYKMPLQKVTESFIAATDEILFPFIKIIINNSITFFILFKSAGKILIFSLTVFHMDPNIYLAKFLKSVTKMTKQLEPVYVSVCL